MIKVNVLEDKPVPVNARKAEAVKVKSLSPTVHVPYDDAEVRRMIEEKADKEHTHPQYLTEHQDISGKSDVGHTHPQYLTEHQSLDGKADKEHIHSASDVYFEGNYEGMSVGTGFGQVVTVLTEIVTDLGNKSDINHEHSNYVNDVKMNGTSIVNNGSVNIRLNSKGLTVGNTNEIVLKTGNGLGFNANGYMFVSTATDTNVNERTQYIPLGTDKIDLAVKQALVDSKVQWTNSEKSKALQLLGASDVEHKHDGMYVTMGQYTDDMFYTQLIDWNIEYGSTVDFDEILAWASGENGRSRNVRVFDMESLQYAIMSRVEIIDGMPYLVWANDIVRYKLSYTGEWSREEIQQYTDEHINELIAAQIGVIEDGAY